MPYLVAEGVFMSEEKQGAVEGLAAADGFMVNAGLVGVTGYTGMELARILAVHPRIRLKAVTSRQEEGRFLADLYPFLRESEAGRLVVSGFDPDALAAACSLVFLAVPGGAAMEMAAPLRERGLKVVDLSADFRLRDPGVYEEWYKLRHSQPGLLREAVYGLPELYAEQIRLSSLVANPGCYPTACILGLYPALKHGLIQKTGIVIDAKSGVTGAGRKSELPYLFSEVYDNFRPYALPRHRHIPEMEQELSAVAGSGITLSFNPHLLPLNRGILASIYTRPLSGVSPEALRELYAENYAGHEFVRVLPEGALPDLRSVRGSMFCDLALVPDARTGVCIIISAIDNICRGASGQAVANANLMSGLPLGCGLNLVPLAP
jgi:N-acetyl-gamma-glutamyl-phosphate reductase